MDSRLVTGIFIGMVLGLQYHSSLIAYLPVMLFIVIAIVLKAIHH